MSSAPQGSDKVTKANGSMQGGKGCNNIRIDLDEADEDDHDQF